MTVLNDVMPIHFELTASYETFLQTSTHVANLAAERINLPNAFQFVLFLHSEWVDYVSHCDAKIPIVLLGEFSLTEVDRHKMWRKPK